MIIRQFLHQEPVGISYLFGCGGRKNTIESQPHHPLCQYRHRLALIPNDLH